MAPRSITLGFAAAALLMAVACTRSDPSKAAGPQAVPVKVQTAQLQKVDEFTEYLATVRSLDASVLQPEVEGQVVKITVHSGQHVEAGTPLIEIDPRKQEATVNSQQAEHRSRVAQMEYDRKELERRKQLYAAGVISKQDLDQAQTAYDNSSAAVESAAANVRQQEVQLRYYVVKAPTAGVVGDIPVRVGDRVKNDTVLTTIDTGKGLEAYISIPAEKAGEARLGTPVELLDESGKPVLRTSVTFVSPRIDTQTQLLLIKAAIPNSERGFVNAQVVHARVVWKQADHPMVPVTAIARMTGQTFAYVAESDGKNTVARQRSVRLGEIVGNNYVVLDGIKPGDKVIVTGIQMLIDGMPVAPSS